MCYELFRFIKITESLDLLNGMNYSSKNRTTWCGFSQRKFIEDTLHVTGSVC